MYILFQDASVLVFVCILINLFSYVFFSLNTNSSTSVKSVTSSTYSGKLTRFYSNVLMVRVVMVGIGLFL